MLDENRCMNSQDQNKWKVSWIIWKHWYLWHNKCFSFPCFSICTFLFRPASAAYIEHTSWVTFYNTYHNYAEAFERSTVGIGINGVWIFTLCTTFAVFSSPLWSMLTSPSHLSLPKLIACLSLHISGMHPEFFIWEGGRGW